MKAVRYFRNPRSKKVHVADPLATDYGIYPRTRCGYRVSNLVETNRVFFNTHPELQCKICEVNTRLERGV